MSCSDRVVGNFISNRNKKNITIIKFAFPGKFLQTNRNVTDLLLPLLTNLAKLQIIFCYSLQLIFVNIVNLFFWYVLEIFVPWYFCNLFFANIVDFFFWYFLQIFSLANQADLFFVSFVNLFFANFVNFFWQKYIISFIPWKSLQIMVKPTKPWGKFTDPFDLNYLLREVFQQWK